MSRQFSIHYSKKIALVFCYGLSLFFSTSLFSQNPIQERALYMSQLGVKDGLTAGLITTLTEDNKGYLWMGTPDGLNRYDGYRIKKYVNEPGNPNSLLTNYINKILIDSRGWMWVSTSTGGLHVYNEKEDNFLRIPYNQIHIEIHEDQNGDIWYHTNKFERNIIQIDPEFSYENSLNLTLDDITIKTQQELYPNLPKSKRATEMVISKKTGLWIHDFDSLYNYNLNKEKGYGELLFKKRTDDLVSLYDRGGHLIVNSNNEQIIILGKTKIIVFDGIHKKVSDAIKIPDHFEFPIRIELIDHKNRLWLNARGIIYRLDLNLKTWKKIILQTDGSRGKQLAYAKNFIEDKHHNIWIATGGYGVFKCSYVHDSFNYYGTDRSGPSVYTIRDFEENSILLSSSNARSMLEVLNYDNQTLKKVTLPNTYFSGLGDSFNVFFKDSKQRIWVPSRTRNNDRGYKILLLNKDLELIYDIETPQYNNKEALITYVFETADGQIWGVGALNNGNEINKFPHVYLSKWFENEKQFKIESVFKDHPNGFVFHQCSTSQQSPDGSLWLGLEIGGMLNYNPINKKWRHFSITNEFNQIPSDNILSSLISTEHPDTNFWLGTRNGLIDFNYINGTFKVYGENNGLPNNVIYGILTDDKNNLWLSSNNGISSFNPVTHDVTNYDTEDGLQSAEFNRWAYHKKEDGTLFFGGVGGLSWFHPKDLETSQDIAKIEINGLKLNNKRADSLLIISGQGLEFPYEQGLITFEFSKLNLTAPSRIKYIYKLIKDGDEEDWVEIGNQPSITFTELSPDDYTFYISTYNADGSVSTKQDSIAFNIAEPWWCNDWLKVLAVIIIGLICYYLYVVKIRSQLELEKLKSTISRDLHDEIGSTLSSISLYGTIAEQELTSNPEKVKNLIQKINSYSSESIEAMNDIVWAIKSGNETLEQLINRIRFYSQEIEETGHWKVNITYDKQLLNVSLDMLKMRNIYLILKEGINNAIKHSEGDNIEARFLSFQGNNMIVVEVEDNGKGFNRENDNFVKGNGLINMDQRADELNGSLEYIALKGKGTKIKLVFYNK